MLYALDIRENISFGDCLPQEPEQTIVCKSLGMARTAIVRWLRDVSWVNEWTGYVYDMNAWDGISYGDPIGFYEPGPRGGIRYERWG